MPKGCICFYIVFLLSLAPLAGKGQTGTYDLEAAARSGDTAAQVKLAGYYFSQNDRVSYLSAMNWSVGRQTKQCVCNFPGRPDL